MSILSQNINYQEIYEISILNELNPMQSSLKTFQKLHVIYQWVENLKLLVKN